MSGAFGVLGLRMQAEGFYVDAAYYAAWAVCRVKAPEMATNLGSPVRMDPTAGAAETPRARLAGVSVEVNAQGLVRYIAAAGAVYVLCFAVGPGPAFRQRQSHQPVGWCST